MTITAVIIPARLSIVAAISAIPMAFRFVVAIVTNSIIHQRCIEADVVLWIKALAIIAVSIPVRAVIVAAVSSVVIAFLYVVAVMTKIVIPQTVVTSN